MNKLSKCFEEALTAASCLEDLLPFLKCMDVDSIRAFIDESISKESSVYYQTLPITETLHKDICQHITSFLSPYDVSPVSKLFNELSIAENKKRIGCLVESDQYTDCMEAFNKSAEYRYLEHLYLEMQESINQQREETKALLRQNKNRARRMSSLQEDIQNLLKPILLLNSESNEYALPKFPVEYNNDFNQTLLVSKHRYKLTRQERKSGYVGPYMDPMAALEDAKSGDRILIEPGVYDYMDAYDCWSDSENDCDSTYENPSFIFDSLKSVFLIGMKCSSTKNARDIDSDESEDESAHEDVAKIVLKSTEWLSKEQCLLLKKDCNLFMEKIVIDTTANDHETKGHDLKFLENTAAIEVEKRSKLWLKDCTIKTGYGQIAVRTGLQSSLFVENTSFIGGPTSNMAVSMHLQSRELLIANCIMIGFRKGQPNIQINVPKVYAKKQNTKEYEDVSLFNAKIVNNVFSSPPSLESRTKVLLKHNTVRG